MHPTMRADLERERDMILTRLERADAAGDDTANPGYMTWPDYKADCARAETLDNRLTARQLIAA